MLVEAFPGLGGGDAAGRPDQQLDPQRVFENPDKLRLRGLGEVQRAGRATHRPAVDDLSKAFDLA